MGKSHFLRLSGKWINSSGVSSEKLPFVMKLPQGLLFLINRHFWKFQTCPFWKKYAFPYIWAYLVPIGPYLVPIWSLLGPIWSLFGPYWALFDPYWALFGSIGPYLALLGPIGPYLALLGLIWPWQLNKSVTQKVPTEDTERIYSCISRYMFFDVWAE